MIGTIAVTDQGWYQRLAIEPGLDEVNFWKPSAARPFGAPLFSPFLFKLKSPHNAICGFGYFARYSSLPDWLAWEAFGTKNGCVTLQEMRDRIAAIRGRIRFRGQTASPEIGAIVVVQPTFFPSGSWVPQPTDWPARTVGDKKYDLSVGEGKRVWLDCLSVASALRGGIPSSSARAVLEQGLRYGTPVLSAPRLGQGAFRVAITDIYQRCCAVSEEHSLPVLEAAHIQPFAQLGPHEPANGLLLRADIHRLFDKGYMTISNDFRVEVSRRLKEDFDNGRSYYPFQGKHIHIPGSDADRPAISHLQWHQENCYRG